LNDFNYDYMNYSSDMAINSYNNNFPGYGSSNNYGDNYNKANIVDIKKNNMNYMNKQYNVNKQILDPYQGFIRGNIFNNLYDGYKNLKPSNIEPNNDREALLVQWLQYEFSLNDLNLYLDLYPNDVEALTLYKRYLDIDKEVKMEYEKKYGPLCLDSNYVSDNSWKWIKSPWPWEVIK